MAFSNQGIFFLFSIILPSLVSIIKLNAKKKKPQDLAKNTAHSKAIENGISMTAPFAYIINVGLIPACAGSTSHKV